MSRYTLPNFPGFVFRFVRKPHDTEIDVGDISDRDLASRMIVAQRQAGSDTSWLDFSTIRESAELAMFVLTECRICGKSTGPADSDWAGVGLCGDCYEVAGMENAHSDGQHEFYNPDCAACVAEFPAKLEAAKATAVAAIDELIAGLKRIKFEKKS